MKKQLKSVAVFGMVVTMACALCACSDKEADKETAKRLEESNKKVNEQAEEFEFREEEHGAVLVKYNGSDKEIEIPKDYNNLPVVRIEETTFTNVKNIKSVKIPSSVQSIAFSTLPENEDITIYAALNTAGQMYCYNRGLSFVEDGVNNEKASSVTIYDFDGKFNEIIYVGEEPKEEFLSGVKLVEENGETVLILDNCNIGGISAQEYAALTIRLADGSENTVTGNRGLDGIASSGNLTITGNGTLHITGSDHYSTGEGDHNYIGSGIWVLGNLTIENQVKMDVKAGTSKSYAMVGIQVYSGNLTVKDCRVEAVGSSENVAGAAVLVTNYDMREDAGKLTLEQAQIAEGGSPVELKDEDGSVYGMGIGTGDISYDEITNGYVNAAAYVRIEPAAGQ